MIKDSKQFDNVSKYTPQMITIILNNLQLVHTFQLCPIEKIYSIFTQAGTYNPVTGYLILL